MNGTTLTRRPSRVCSCHDGEPGALPAPVREWEEEAEWEEESEWEQAAEWGQESEWEEEYEYFVFGRDDRILTTNTRDAPFRYICNLEFNGWSMCSGTLIGPRTVLTAGHCIVDTRARRLRNPALMRVIPGRNGSLEPLPATRALRLIPFPSFAAVTRSDIGIIHLRHPIGSTVGFWTQAYSRRPFDSTGTSMSSQLPMRPGALPVNVSGYPADLPATPRFRCRAGGACVNSPLRPPRNRVVCGTSQHRAFDQTVALTPGGMLTYRNDTCGGHSGSPVWVRRHPSMGGRVLVGVHVGFVRSATGVPTVNQAVHLTGRHLAWIRANTV